jgi:predicted RNA-binding protein with RPS1 domain
MEEVITKIEEKVMNILEINNKCLNALKNLLEENKKMKTQLEDISARESGVEEQLLRLLSNIETAESIAQETKEAQQEIFEIL